MRRSLTALLFAVTTAFLSACQTTDAPKPGNTPANQPKPAASASPTVPTASPAADPKATAPSAKAAEFEGQWTGQGGSSFKISKKGETYTIEINKGGKAEKFEGVAKDGTILMKRGDKSETITVATPAETGLTWSGGEKTCLVITKGSEAYCRK
jgi:hypothetical protein